MINDIRIKFKNYKPYINGSKDMKKSSVLIPIIKKDDSYFILFQVRSSTLKTQPNEICFPGGKIEYNEKPIYTCVRETCEELGITNDNIEIISELDLFITPSNMIIHPFLGIIKNIDNLNINKDEVDHVFLVPITYLLKNKPITYTNEVSIIPSNDFPYEIIPNQTNYKFAKGNYDVLFYKYNDYIIWGLRLKYLKIF